MDKQMTRIANMKKYKICTASPKRHAITKGHELHIFTNNYDPFHIFSCENHAHLVDTEEFTLTYAAPVD